MEGILQFALLLMLTASLMLQFGAAVISIRLIRISRNHPAWILISLALVLMTIRRSIIFYHLLSGGVNHLPDLYAEMIAFVISLLLVAGLLALMPLVRRLYGSAAASDDVSFGELFEKTTSGVAVYEAVDKGRDFIIVDINPAAERIEKLAREHAIDRRLTEVFPKIEEFGLLEILRRVWKTGRSESFPLHYYQDERISGWRDHFVYRRSGGGVVAVYNDVSTQMHMQEELERRERKFRMLFEQAPRPYQVLDGDGKILEVNPAWLRLTSLDRASVTGRPFSELLTRTGRQRFQECLEELTKNAEVDDVHLELRPKDGILLNVEMDALAQRSRTGGLEQIYCMLQETSGQESILDANARIEKRARMLAMEMQAGERRELERQRLSMFGELTGGMAHELNTPLSAARNAFNLMREGLPPVSPHYEFAGIAARELSRMAEMVERMYQFHEPVPQECEAININALLDNTLVLVRSSMREHGIQLRDERAPVVPLVLLPPGAVMLTLINPVKNGIEAMSMNGILTLRTGPEERNGVFVEIEDNGSGIPQEFLPRLFEPFTTFRHSGAEHSGIGLGMAIVQRTLDVLGGSVTVRSGTGEGTCVRIVFPARMEATR
jgi:PAS domain S-box-containing protein